MSFCMWSAYLGELGEPHVSEWVSEAIVVSLKCWCSPTDGGLSQSGLSLSVYSHVCLAPSVGRLRVCKLKSEALSCLRCSLFTPPEWVKTEAEVCEAEVCAWDDRRALNARALRGCEWVMLHEWAMPHMNGSCQIWMGHVTYEWVMFQKARVLRALCVF